MNKDLQAAAVILFGFVLFGCTYIRERTVEVLESMDTQITDEIADIIEEDDNVVEEFIEDVIEYKLGIDIDLTPDSKEK